jgi:hypothetical protein
MLFFAYEYSKYAEFHADFESVEIIEKSAYRKVICLKIIEKKCIQKKLFAKNICKLLVKKRTNSNFPHLFAYNILLTNSQETAQNF